jgi:hypothetical protein
MSPADSKLARTLRAYLAICRAFPTRTVSAVLAKQAGRLGIG